MEKAQIVIGANFGDEGKGLITDYLAAPHGPRALVARFNGGAQAGHTVVAPDGRRHVFSHFGSGTLAGAASYLTRFFVAHPMLFLVEAKVLRALGVDPLVYAHPDMAITTPYDMMINQFAEQARGGARHGSCGLGFGAAVERNADSRYDLTLRDLFDRDRVVARLQSIRADYLPSRLSALGVPSLSAEQRAMAECDGIFERWLLDIDDFLASIEVVGDTVISSAEQVIFEGAQGLLLDQRGRYFPHLTRSNTGLRNVFSLAGDIGLESLDVIYVTRSYLTRHGAGPLPGEAYGAPCEHVVDETNITNSWQGSLRFAPLDLDLLGGTIRCDLREAASALDIRIEHRLAVTCLDQIDGEIDVIQSGRRQRVGIATLLERSAAAAGTHRLLAVSGPTRADVSPSIASLIPRVIDRDSFDGVPRPAGQTLGAARCSASGKAGTAPGGTRSATEGQVPCSVP